MFIIVFSKCTGSTADTKLKSQFYFSGGERPFLHRRMNKKDSIILFLLILLARCFSYSNYRLKQSKISLLHRDVLLIGR